MTSHSVSEPPSPEPDPSYDIWRSPSGSILEHHFADDRWASVLGAACQCDVLAMLDLACQTLNIPPVSLSVCWTDNASIAELNRQFRAKDKPTNILSFASDMPDEDGELVLGYEVVTSEAEQAGISPAHHITHLILHGVLHLQGYEHHTDEDAVEMEQFETAILARLNIADPHHGELV